MTDGGLLLETEFCPILDSALVYAIYHDHGDQVQEARDVLNDLKAFALAEQSTGFDPSGMSGRPAQNGDNSLEIDTSTESEITAISQNLSSLDIHGARSHSGSSHEGTPDQEVSGVLVDLELLDISMKEDRLVETFPTLKRSTVAYTLQKSGGNFERATDELLNQVYFADAVGEDIILNKGVDAFFKEDTTQKRGRKRKTKKNKRGDAYSGSSAEVSPDSPNSSNKWTSGSDDIGFLSSRLGLPTSTVSSVYRKAGGSVPGSLQTFIAADTKEREGEDVIAEDLVKFDNALKLHTDYPKVPLEHAVSLVRLTHPSLVAAQELAAALVKPAAKTPPGRIEIIQRYTPIDLTDRLPASPRSPQVTTPLSSRSTASLANARGVAFEQASAAYRKGKSDPLMKAAAGYYGQLGRDYDAAMKASSSSDADALVAAQSTARQLDLHGVSVKDATRIARESVTAWWHGLGDSRYGRGENPGVGGGYKIVTGKGTHSDGGRGKLGPAVGNMLVREGWKMQAGDGFIVVTGVAKKR